MFCISPDQLNFLVKKAIIDFTNEEMFKFTRKGMSYDEMFQQAYKESGPYNEALVAAIKKFNNKTENVEVQVALELVKIYDIGPKDEIVICFEMKSNFSGKVLSLSDLISNIESKTHIDCTIRSKVIEARFQIKRYSSEYLKYSEADIISYLEKIFREKYGKMADTNLIVLLQPTQEAAITPLNFEKIYQFMKEIGNGISFGEVSFIFNANMKNIMLVRVFPDFKKKTIPFYLRSPKYQELQSRWEDEMRKRQN